MKNLEASLKEVNGVKVDADLEREDWSVDWGFVEAVIQGKIYGKVISTPEVGYVDEHGKVSRCIKMRYMMVTGSRTSEYQLVWLGNEDVGGWSLCGKCTYLRDDGCWRMLYARGKRQVGLWLQWNGWKPCEISIDIKEKHD